MKVIDAVAYVDKVCHNDVDQAVKIGLLERLDAQIYRDVYATHCGECKPPEKPYTEQTELLVPDCCGELYHYYLQARLCLILNQVGLYQTFALLYENAYAEFIKEYNRTHVPVHRVSALRFT